MQTQMLTDNKIWFSFFWLTTRPSNPPPLPSMVFTDIYVTIGNSDCRQDVFDQSTIGTADTPACILRKNLKASGGWKNHLEAPSYPLLSCTHKLSLLGVS